MVGLDRFERIMERAVEGSVGRVFRNQVQPAEIGRRLEQAMEARPLVSVNGTIVPNDYQVHLNPEDAAVFQPMQYELCQSFAQWLGEIGGERGYRFMGPINVSLMSDPNVARRDVQVQAAAQSPAPPPQAYIPPSPPRSSRHHRPVKCHLRHTCNRLPLRVSVNSIRSPCGSVRRMTPTRVKLRLQADGNPE